MSAIPEHLSVLIPSNAHPPLIGVNENTDNTRLSNKEKS